MQVTRAVGREAAARKYDLLSAMLAHALGGDAMRQRLVLRLVSLITTRYNWQRDELAVGQREIARLWCVDERTVKRDMARLRGLGWIVVKRQGARGRVSVLGLDLARIMLDTRPQWENIGPDYVARMGLQDPEPDGDSIDAGNIVPFPNASISSDRPSPEGLWHEVAARLRVEDRATYDIWFAPLCESRTEQGVLHLAAPSRFHATYLRTHLAGRLQTALRRADPSMHTVRIEAP